MKQVVQDVRGGRTQVREIPDPAALPGHVVVRTVASLVSAGTERYVVDLTLGFNVMVAENLTRQQFSQTLLAFDNSVGPGDTAFFFFAGHGFEIAGQN